MIDALKQDSWNWQEHKKQEAKKEKPVDMESSGVQGDVDISSNFSKHKVVMVVGRKDYNWIATLAPVTAREYARQLIAAADAVDNAMPEETK